MSLSLSSESASGVAKFGLVIIIIINNSSFNDNWLKFLTLLRQGHPASDQAYDVRCGFLKRVSCFSLCYEIKPRNNRAYSLNPFCLSCMCMQLIARGVVDADFHAFIGLAFLRVKMAVLTRKLMSPITG